MASRSLKPLPRAKPSGLSFHAHFVNVAAKAGLTAPTIYAHRLNPDFAEAHYNLSLVLQRMPGREADASRELATALRIKPGLGQPCR